MPRVTYDPYCCTRSAVFIHLVTGQFVGLLGLNALYECIFVSHYYDTPEEAQAQVDLAHSWCEPQVLQ